MVLQKLLVKLCYVHFIINCIKLRRVTLYERLWTRQDYHGAYIAVIMRMLDAIDKSPTIMGVALKPSILLMVTSNIKAMSASSMDIMLEPETELVKGLAEEVVNLTRCNQPIQYQPTVKLTVKNRIVS